MATKFLSRSSIKKIADTTTDPTIRIKAQSALVAYDAHLALQQFLVESIENNKEDN